ncbi:MAG: hypothetical protein R2710_27745 [Acidimicrobiales bacterium]
MNAADIATPTPPSPEPIAGQSMPPGGDPPFSNASAFGPPPGGTPPAPGESGAPHGSRTAFLAVIGVLAVAAIAGECLLR